MAGTAPNRTKRYVELSTREAVLQAAEDVCAEAGPEQVKIRELARIIGIKPASLYNHFSSREDILAGVVKGALETLVPILEDAINYPPLEGVEKICRADVELFYRRPGIARLVLADFAEVRGMEGFDENARLIERISDAEKAVYLKGQDQGLFHPCDLSDTVMARLGLTLVIISSRWLRKVPYDVEQIPEIADTVTRFMIGYLTNPANKS